MIIHIELSPLMVAVIQERLDRSVLLNEKNEPRPMEASVAEWVTGLIQGQLEAMASVSRHPDVLAHKAQIETSQAAFREALFPKKK
jgi:hypothetical protein